ncbi:flap endonuclease Xni [Motiliproteus sp. SC1-56]|uniref:flap endonuclease Xni n=1 Tax=Motiliproteus sp. SC1-56 TaxID=2799565 RepID=UPI001A8C726E
MSGEQPHLLLVDALNLIRRIHAAVPGDGEAAMEGALTSAGQAVGRLLSRFQPSHGVCAFDGWEKSWRHQAYPEYKAGRKPMPDDLKQGMERFHALFRYKGLTSLTYVDLEADDILATLAMKTLSRGGRVTLVSTDKGFAQLLGGDYPDLLIWDHFARQAVDRDFVVRRFGVEPGQLADYLALCGDTTNHIRGVDGIGAKTAAKLLAEYGNLETLYAHLEELPKGQAAKLQGTRNWALQARHLVRLRTDLELDCRLKAFRLGAAMSLPQVKEKG